FQGCFHIFTVHGTSLSRRCRERPHADLFEPHDVAGIMVLETDITNLGTFRLAFRLEPLPLTRDIGAFGVEAGHSLALQFYEYAIAGQSNYHSPPPVTSSCRRCRGWCEGIDGPGPVELVVRVHDLNLISAMHGKPRSFLALRRSHHALHRGFRDPPTRITVKRGPGPADLIQDPLSDSHADAE